MPVDTHASIRTYVTIMKGCDNFCSYCVVPYVRGRESSRKSGEVLEEIKRLAEKGTKAGTRLGQNVNAYNKNCGDISFRSFWRK